MYFYFGVERVLRESILARRSFAEKRGKHRAPGAPDLEGGSSMYKGKFVMLCFSVMVQHAKRLDRFH